MTRFQRILHLLIALTMIASLLCGPVANAQEVTRVVAVEVSGNRNISTPAVLAAVGSKVGEPFSEEQVEKDVAAIRALGYFVNVTSRVEDVPGGKRITFEVVENPRITQINIVGNTAIPTKDILGVMETKVGEVLNTQTLSKDVEAIVRLYAQRGYPAEVSDVHLDEQNQGILTITILEARIEAIRVVGLKKTKEYVVTRELKTKPGDLYNAQQISRDITRVMNLNLFEDVTARPEPGTSLGKVILVITVVERKTGQVILGFGYSNREKLVGRAELSESNFRGRGQGLNLTFEVGGRGGGTSFELGYFEPWLDKRHTSLSASVYNRLVYRFQSNLFQELGPTTGTSTAYNERRKGGTILVGRPAGEFTRYRIGFRGENVTTNLLAGTTTDTTSFPPLDGSVISTTLGALRDTRDYVADPTTGSYMDFSLEPGRATLDKDPITLQPVSGFFLKPGAEYRRYYTIFSKNVARDRRRVLALRAIGRTSSGTIPFFEQYFVGGSETLRGYTEDRFWGRNMVLLSSEVRVPVASNLQGVLFLDVGDAWGASSELIEKYGKNKAGQIQQSTGLSLHAGYGVGLRVRTPIGPLRLDYGFGSEGSRLHFSIGQVF